MAGLHDNQISEQSHIVNVFKGGSHSTTTESFTKMWIALTSSRIRREGAIDYSKKE